MAKILTRLGTRCVEHPHRPTERLCDRCGRPFCAPCLVPGPRAADGTREWCCRPCRDARRTERAATAAARSWRGRAARAGRGARALLPVLVAAGAAAAVLALAVRTYRPGAAVPLAACGELTRIRSVGAIGTQAAEDAVNVLAYPQRAEVRLGAGGAGPGADGAAAALVDECQSGWRSAGPRALPVEVVLDTRRPGSAVQRLALWQDPGAPRGAWVRDFEALASPSADGDDFQAIPLDRPGRLRETTEPQWFEVQRPAPGATGAPFPDVVPLRRLRLRLLSTHGDPAGGPAAATGGAPGEVALGEVAAYGPDLEVVLAHPTGSGRRGPRPLRRRPGGDPCPGPAAQVRAVPQPHPDVPPHPRLRRPDAQLRGDDPTRRGPRRTVHGRNPGAVRVLLPGPRPRPARPRRQHRRALVHLG